jgi:molybdate transport system ATP-binding protein
MIRINIKRKLHGADGIMDFSVNINIAEKSFIAVTGDSGSGKTSMLRMIAGLTLPNDGYVDVASHRWFDSESKINIPTNKRNIGFVFQDYALFPNMTVRENISYANKDKGLISELLEIMELRELEKRYPDKLSGGQKQRVALARALARRPDLLLLDEPLSALDSGLRFKMQDQLINAHRKLGCTIILVSHDIPGIVKMAERIIILERGKVIRDIDTNFINERQTIPDYYSLLIKSFREETYEYLA